MANPKRKTSKQRRDKRRTHYKAYPATMSVCPKCGASKLAHRACGDCGYYNGRKVLTYI